MKVSRFMKNAAVLTVTALLLRLAGMILRVYLANTIGSEGMGLYQLVFSVYTLAATFASGGFSVAVTRLITEEKAGRSRVKHILARSTSITLGIAFVTMAVIWVFASPICSMWIKDARAEISLKILSFSLPFMAINCNIRGYFISVKRVSVPSNAQLFEQAVRIAVIIAVMPVYAERGIEYACAAILFADSAAEALATLFIYIGYRLDLNKRSFHNKKSDKMTGTVRKILKIAMPITGGKYLNSLLRTAENLLVPTMLTKYNLSRAQAVSQFGDLKGMAMPLILFPASFLTALSTLLVPELSGAKADNNTQMIASAVTKTIRFTLTVSLFIAAAFVCFCEPICLAVYNNTEIAYYLKWLCPLIPLMYLESVTAGMMQGLDQQTRTFTYNLIDSVCRICFIYFLLPQLGMAGFMIVMIISNLLTSLLNLHRLIKISNIKFDWYRWLIKPLLLSVFSVLAARAALFRIDASSIVMSCLYVCVSGLAYFGLIRLFDDGIISDIKSQRR